MPINKADRKRYGVTGQPVQAVQAFRKPMQHDAKGMKTESWILVTPAGTRIHVNTYNGDAGKGFDPSTGNHPMPAENTKERKQVLKGYTEVDVSECPIATKANATSSAAAPQAQAPASV